MSSSGSGARRREVVMTYPRLAEAKNRGGGGVNICARPAGAGESARVVAVDVAVSAPSTGLTNGKRTPPRQARVSCGEGVRRRKKECARKRKPLYGRSRRSSERSGRGLKSGGGGGGVNICARPLSTAAPCAVAAEADGAGAPAMAITSMGLSSAKLISPLNCPGRLYTL